MPPPRRTGTRRETSASGCSPPGPLSGHDLRDRGGELPMRLARIGKLEIVRRLFTRHHLQRGEDRSRERHDLADLLLEFIERVELEGVRIAGGARVTGKAHLALTGNRVAAVGLVAAVLAHEVIV